MIATLTGVVAERDDDSLVVQTDGGVGYAVSVPLGSKAALAHVIWDRVLELLPGSAKSGPDTGADTG